MKKLISPFQIALGRTPVIWRYSKQQGDEDLEYLLRLYAENYFHGWAGVKYAKLNTAMYFFMLAIWPFQASCIVAINTLRYSRRFDKTHKRSVFLQIFDQLRIALQYWHHPEVYFKYELSVPEELRSCRNYLLQSHKSALYPLISSEKVNGRDFALDKIDFTARLEAASLPVPETLLIVESGGIASSMHSPSPSTAALPTQSFILKPSDGVAGRNIFRVEYQAGGLYWCSNGHTYYENQMLEFINSLSHASPMILQAVLSNHRDMADLVNGSLGTCRVVSGITLDGAVRIISGALRMPVGRAVVDNFDAGGIAASIDVASGTLGIAVSSQPMGPRHTVHPDTNAKIQGRELPFWGEALTLVEEAHRSVAKRIPFMGWDIAITDQGPLILEGQVSWGYNIAQMPGRVGLGSTEFPAIFRMWMESSVGKGEPAE